MWILKLRSEGVDSFCLAESQNWNCETPELFDLPGFSLSECRSAGLRPDQIYVEPMDTAADVGQFPHYAGTEDNRPEKQGRLVCYGFMG